MKWWHRNEFKFGKELASNRILGVHSKKAILLIHTKKTDVKLNMMMVMIMLMIIKNIIIKFAGKAINKI